MGLYGGTHEPSRPRVLEDKCLQKIVKLQGNVSSVVRLTEPRSSPARQNCANFNRLGNNSRVCEFSRGYPCRPIRHCYKDLDNGNKVQFVNFRKMVGREIKYDSRQVESFRQQVKLGTPPIRVQAPRWDLGPPYNRQICLHEFNKMSTVQFKIHRPIYFGGGRPLPKRLGSGKQLCQPPNPPFTRGYKDYRQSECNSNSDSPGVQGPRFLPGVGQSLNQSSDSSAETASIVYKTGKSGARTMGQPQVEIFRLEDSWNAKLKDKKWPECATDYYPRFLADSSLSIYNKYINEFLAFCDNIALEEHLQRLIMEFLISKAQRSERPDSMIRTISAALKHFTMVKFDYDPFTDNDMHRFTQGLVKSETSRPRERTKIIPIQPLLDVFLSWPSNENLSLKDLRLKAIALISLTAMCRPSDLVPKSILRRSQLQLNTDGTLTIRLFGIKNDRKREGFEIRLHPADDKKIDPVNCAMTYIKRTDTLSGPVNGPLFITLNHPFKQIDSSTVSLVLASALRIAGLPRDFPARCFRPTGVTLALQEGISERTVQQTAHLKSDQVFHQHYVYPMSKENVTNAILQSKFTPHEC